MSDGGRRETSEADWQAEGADGERENMCNANFLTFKLERAVQHDEGVWKPIKKKTKLRKNNWAKFLPRLAAFCETGQINIFPAWTQQQLTVEARTEQSGDEKSSCQEFAHGNLPGCVFFFFSFFDVNLRMTSVFVHISQSVRSHMKPPLSFRINCITVKAQSHFRFVSLHLISSCPSYRIELVVEISPCDTRQPFKTLVCHQLSSIDATGRFQSSAVVIRPVQQ